MEELLIYFFIGIGLSMDAFSLAIVLGINNMSFKKKIIVSLSVGLFHFIMPLIGLNIGKLVLSKIITNTNKIIGIILLFISVEMYLSKDEEKNIIISNFISILLFALTVSLDSLTVGIGYGLTKTKVLIPCLIFSVMSFTFTYIGITLGKKISTKSKKASIFIGILILLIISINYFFI